MEPFVSNLRKRAEQLGISHAEAARRIGLSERRFGNYVSGRREPDLATLVKIAEVLGASLDDLLTSKTDQAEDKLALANERITVATRFLPEAEQETIAVMVEALARRAAKGAD